MQPLWASLGWLVVSPLPIYATLPRHVLERQRHGEVVEGRERLQLLLQLLVGWSVQGFFHATSKSQPGKDSAQEDSE